MQLEDRTYLSTELLEAVEMFAKNAQTLETPRPQPGNLAERQNAYSQSRFFSLGAIVCAAAYIKARINEFISDLADSPDRAPSGVSCDAARRIGALCQSARRLQPMKKYERIIDFAGTQPFDRGRSPYQDAQALFKLRNALVHFVPEWQTIGDETRVRQREKHGIENALQGRFELFSEEVRAGFRSLQ
jgi:hypothetical protein